MNIHKFILGGLLLLAASVASGQSENDSIEIKKVFLGTDFSQNGRHLNIKQLLDITKSNPEAYREMKVARNNFVTAGVLAGASAILILWPIVTKPSDGDINWTPAAIGAVVYITSIPFINSYLNHTKRAVNIYNSGIGKVKPPDMSFNISLTGNGVGIKVTF
jgi:hypothetical protein